VGPRQVDSATGGETVGQGWRYAPVAREAYTGRLTGGDLSWFKQPGRSGSTGLAQHPDKL
jgi:hypothetical protein